MNGPGGKSTGSPPVRLSIVIPAFNEARRLPGSLRTIMAHLRGNARWLAAEVIIADDGSSDATAASIEGIGVPDGVTLRLVRHERNRGKGAAVRTGFAASHGELILLSDADLATPIEELERLADSAGPDTVVIGSKAIDRSLITVHQPWYRDIMGRTFNLLVRTLLLPGLHDTQCGFKLFPGPAGRAFAAVQTVEGFAFDVELLLLAKLWGMRIEEVGVRWRHVEPSRVSPALHSFEMFCDVLRLAWRYRRGELPSRPAGFSPADRG